jgi:hypothetical protein
VVNAWFIENALIDFKISGYNYSPVSVLNIGDLYSFTSKGMSKFSRSAMEASQPNFTKKSQ